MYIEWKREEMESNGARHKMRLIAVLVDGFFKGGEACDEPIVELGSVEERYITVRIRTMREFHKGLFWTAIDKQLDRLCVETDVRRLIEAEIAEKISRPNDEWALWGVTCVPCYD